MHLPVYLDARARGFDQQFTGQYLSWFHLVRTGLFAATTGVVGPGARSACSASRGRNGCGIAPGAEVKKEAPTRSIDRSALQRPAVSGAWTLPSFYERAFPAIIHLPLLIAPIFVVAFSLALLLALVRRRMEAVPDYLAVLTALGCSLTLFPQYYFFRPDTPHLSEFMAPFLVALAMASWCAARHMRRAGLSDGCLLA